MDAGAYERRHRLLAGLRALPTGRFFVGSEDVYPEIIDSWRQPSTPMAGSSPGVRPNVFRYRLVFSPALSLSLKQPLTAYCDLETTPR